MTLEYKGITIEYTDQGTGETLVLLHGFLENLTMWDVFIPELTKKCRVVCIDLLGHGKTGCLGYLHTMEAMAEAVKAVLDSLEITKATFIGHSMGGYVALAFAEKNPKTLKGLCLMNSTALADTEEKKLNRDRAIIAVKQNHKTFIRLAINNLFRPKNRIIFSNQIKELIQSALNTPLQGIIAALEGMKIRENRQHIFKSTHFFKMLIVSKKDPVLEYNSLINQVQETDVFIAELPDGHMSHIENEMELLQIFMRFIEKI